MIFSRIAPSSNRNPAKWPFFQYHPYHFLRQEIFVAQIPIYEIVIASGTLPARGQGSNLVFFNEIATPACPAFAEAPARRTRLWQAGLRAGRRNS